MTTVRQIAKLWESKSYERLFRELLAARPEASFRLEIELSGPVPAAALALIRLNELNQGHALLATTLVRALLSAQQSDGGWSDPMTTALALRALLGCHGTGAAIDRGLFYFASLQKSEGIWPNVPIRRMPADPYVSAFILYQLAEFAPFRSAVRFFDALNWFENNEHTLDADSRRLWDRASLRCKLHRLATPQFAWS
jgi:hypothetical protein